MSQDSGEQDPPGPDGPAPSLAARLAARGAEAEPRPPAGRPSGSIDIEFSSGAAVTLDADGRPAAFADEAARPGAQADAPGDAPPAAPGDAQPPAPGPAADAAPAPGPPRRPTRRSRLRTVPDLLTESLTHLPVVKEVVPKSRRGRVMFRSVVVSFALIALWIIGIVYFQVRSEPVPDFRPQAEAIFVAMRDGRAERVYDEASTRFQELVLEETFLTRVDDMNRTLGRFVEVASVMRTQVYRGPSGRIARMELLLTFQRGDARANVSFYLEGGRWRMLGYGVALPDDVVADATSEQARQERSQAPPEIGELTQQILELSRDGRAGEVWEAAAPVFRDSISKEAFLRLEAERREVLGAFEVILKTGVAPPVSRISPSGSTASYDALLEYRGPSGASVTVSGRFKFQKLDGAWKLSFYKVILPLPRGGDEVAAPGGGGEVAPP